MTFTMKLTLNLQDQILKLLLIKEYGGSIDMVRKGYESIACWTHYMVLIFDSTHDLDHGSPMSNFEIALFQEWMTQIHLNS